ncbi:MAG: DUF1800 domain-containing protein [Chloroflexota bacterium]
MNRRQFITFGHNTTRRPPTQLGRLAKRNANLTAQQEASRFLQQATFGPTLSEINSVTSIGVDAWLEQQFNATQTSTQRYMEEVIDLVYRLDGRLKYLMPFNWAWWQSIMTGEDILRQRVATALTEIFVISTQSDRLEDLGLVFANYYDMLLKNAFGNFRDLLLDVTLHPAMGHYLSHAGNRKADLATNRFPDENYAREVMQLFSIGLFELNADGSRKKDGNGNDIPTYDNADVKEFAKVFTGLTFAEFDSNEDISEEIFAGLLIDSHNGIKPLVMYDRFHEPGPKRLLNGTAIPSGQSGMQDVQDAIGNLFNHGNVGPFMGRLLIQRLVKSNPSPAYIGRVTNAFNDNGSGIRGDMQAFVKAILTDPEARDATFIADPTHGMLREPILRYTQLCRSFEASNTENLFYNSGAIASSVLGQYPFMSPSVFNFFSPDFTPLGPLEEANLDAPEFQITTSVTATKTINFWETAILETLMELPKGELPEDAQPDEKMPNLSNARLDLTPFEGLSVDEMIDRIDLLLTYGSLSDAARAIIKAAMDGLSNSGAPSSEVASIGIYLFISAPDYVILK